MTIRSLFVVISVLNDIDGADLICACKPAGSGVRRKRSSEQLQGFTMYDEELDRLKCYDLRVFVASYGFVIDARESSRRSTVMRRGHEKLIITRKPEDGHYTYWSPHDDADRGTIIDFIQKRKGLTLGAVRKELREWVGGPSPSVFRFPELVSAGTDLEALRRSFDAMQIAPDHPYLEDERALPSTVLRHWRFAETIRMDRYGAAVFAHRDENGVLFGYEIKNAGGFTGFAPGGRKQIWLSNTRTDDQRLVICESAIDALSHAALFDDQHARYASIAGKMTEAQHAVLRVAILAMPGNSEIVAATDADDSGRGLAELIRTIVEECGRPDLTFRRDTPEGAKDFNDLLKSRRRIEPLLRRPEGPSVV